MKKLTTAAWWILFVLSAIVTACTTMLSEGCKYGKPACTAIHLADEGCHMLILRDGTPVPVTNQDLEILAVQASARPQDAGGQ